MSKEVMSFNPSVDYKMDSFLYLLQHTEAMAINLQKAHQEMVDTLDPVKMLKEKLNKNKINVNILKFKFWNFLKYLDG